MPVDQIGKEILRGRKLLLWIGAGNSVSAGIPPDSLESGLAYRLALIHYGNDETVRRELGDRFRLAQFAARIGKQRMRDLIRQQGWQDLPVSLAHQAIAALALEGFHIEIVTTNYDPLLEKALRETGIKPQVISSPHTVRELSENISAVVKLHGCPYTENDPNRLIVLEAELMTPPGWVTAFLNGRLPERVFIYAGFSGNAPYVWASIEGTVRNLEGEINEAFAVDVAPAGEVFDSHHPLGQFYAHCNVTQGNYSDEGADAFFPKLADYVFRSILLEALVEAVNEASRHIAVDESTLRADIQSMSFTSIRVFARRLGCLWRAEGLRVRDTCILRVLKWMLLLSAYRVLENASFRPVFAVPFHPGSNSTASGPVVFVDGFGKEAPFCCSELEQRLTSQEFVGDFQIRGSARWYALILNCAGTLTRGHLGIIPAEEDTTVAGYIPMICLDENSLLGDLDGITGRFS